MNEDIIQQVKTSNPLYQINDKELDLLILKMGAFLSIVNNKKINQAKFLITLLTNPKFQECFFELSSFNNLQSLVECFIEKYPTIGKSKVIYKALRKKNGKSNISRKRSVQQVPESPL